MVETTTESAPNPVMEMVDITAGLVPNTMVEIVKNLQRWHTTHFATGLKKILMVLVNVIMRFCQKMSTTLNCERITFIVSWLGDLYAETFPPLSKTI